MTVVSTAEELFGPPPIEPSADPAQGQKPEAQAGTTAPTPTAPSPLSVTSPSAPVFNLMTPAAWALIEERASYRALPDWNSPTAVARFTESLKWRNGTILLTELADAMGVGPELARVYLRALHRHLRAEGIEMRERRLQRDAALGTGAYYLGEFMWPQDKNTLYQERASLRRAVIKTRAAAKREPSLDADLALQDADDALADCEERVAEMVKATEHFPVERHAFVVVLDSRKFAKPEPADTALSA